MAPLHGRSRTWLLALLGSCLAALCVGALDAGAAASHGRHHAGHRGTRHHCRTSTHRAHKRGRLHRRAKRRCARRHGLRDLSASAKHSPGGGSGSGKHTSSAPANTSPPTIAGSAVQGQTLTASTGSWGGTPPIRYGFQWRRGGGAIAGATAATYVPTAGDVGYQLDVIVVATNEAGTSSATSSRTAPVSAASPPGGPPPPPPPPSVSGISPAGGPEAGGTTVSIAGSGFTGATRVSFGANAAPQRAVNSDNSITAVAPAGSGTVDVTVTTPSGTSATGAVDRFGYVAPAPSDAPGAVHFVKWADSSFDAEDIQSNAMFMWEHFTRMVVFSPFFDARTAWAPPAWLYQDAYAIYVGSSLESEHPEWILRDASGNRLYIPYGNPPNQYAGDISNPAFRTYWIERVKAKLSHGYAGVYVDDVDMWANTGNAKGEKRAPISGVTGQPISDEAWREYLAGFMQELRQAIPGYEIAHNNVWYAGGGAANRGTTAPVVRRQIEQADVLNLERGVRDSGLTGGSGSWSLYNVFTYVDEVHALGRAVKLGGGTYEPAAMEYNLAAYFLISTGRDYISDGLSSQNVKSFWSGWSVNLGDAIGPRERSPSGLWSRRFSNGVVYLLEPGAATQTISLPTTMKSATLGSVASVTLSARQGAVLTSP